MFTLNRLTKSFSAFHTTHRKFLLFTNLYNVKNQLNCHRYSMNTCHMKTLGGLILKQSWIKVWSFSKLFIRRIEILLSIASILRHSCNFAVTSTIRSSMHSQSSILWNSIYLWFKDSQNKLDSFSLKQISAVFKNNIQTQFKSCKSQTNKVS